MKSLLLGLILGLSPAIAVQVHAQPASILGSDYVVWNQPAPNAAAAATYRYTFRLNGGTPTIAAAGAVKCNDVAGGKVDCGIVNPGPQPGSANTLLVSYAIPKPSGGFTADSPTGQCAWTTRADDPPNPTEPPSNFRFLKLIGGIFAAIWHGLRGVFS